MGAGSYQTEIVLNDFSGGYVSPGSKDPAQLAINQSPRMMNIDISKLSIRPMKGFSKRTAATVTGDIHSLWYDYETGDEYASYGTAWGKRSSGNLANLPSGTGKANTAASFSRLDDKVFICNGTDQPQLWNGTALSAIASPPVASWAGVIPEFAVHWMSRIFAVSGDMIFYSAFNDATNFVAGAGATDPGAIKIGLDGTKIKAVIPLANALLVVKDPGLYILRGYTTSATGEAQFDQSTFDYVKVQDDVDAVSWQGICITDSGAFIWGRTHVWHLQGTDQLQGIKADIISDNIRGDLPEITENQNLITAAENPLQQEIWFAVPYGAATITRTYVYNFKLKAWSIRGGYEHKCIANSRNNQRKCIISGGYSPSSYIYLQNDTQNFDGTAPERYIDTAWIQFSAINRGRSPLFIVELSENTAPISAWYRYDYKRTTYDSYTLPAQQSTSSWGTSITSTWGSTAATAGEWRTVGQTTESRNMFGYGRTVQHGFYCRELNAQFAILSVRHPTITVGYR